MFKPIGFQSECSSVQCKWGLRVTHSRRGSFPKDIFVENVFDAILTNLAVDHPQAPLSEPLDLTMFFWSSFAVLPVQRLCAHVHRQGAHPHWSMRQHVSVRQEEVSACAQRVWLHMARGGFNTFITN